MPNKSKKKNQTLRNKLQEKLASFWSELNINIVSCFLKRVLVSVVFNFSDLPLSLFRHLFGRVPCKGGSYSTLGRCICALLPWMDGWMEREQAHSSLGGLHDSYLDSNCSVPRRPCRQSSDTSCLCHLCSKQTLY